MLVLKRKSLQTAIDNLTKQITDFKAANIKKLTEFQDAFIVSYRRNLELTQKKLDTEATKFGKVVKDRAKFTVGDYTKVLDSLFETFGEGSLTVVPYSSRYVISQKPEELERKLSTLKGLLALMEGPELQLTNTLAEKFLGKMDILGLLS